MASDISEAGVPLNINAQPSSLFVQKRGSKILDITGNTRVALTVHLPGNAADAALVVTDLTLYDKGVILNPDKASLAGDYTQFAADAAPITLGGALDYELRDVSDGSRTYVEGDDHISLVTTSVQIAPGTIIPQDEIKGTRWVLFVTDANAYTPSGKCELLRGTPLGFDPRTSLPLFFDTELEGRNLKFWIGDRKSTKIDNGELVFKVNQAELDFTGHSPVIGVTTLEAWNRKVFPCQN